MKRKTSSGLMCFGWVMCLLGLWCAPVSAQQAHNASQSEAESRYVSHPVRHKTPREVADRLAATMAKLGRPTRVIADDDGRQVLVQGDRAQQELANQLIQSIDSATVRTQERPLQQGKPVLRLYPVPAGKLDWALEEVRKRFPDEENVRVAPESKSQRLVVLAPESIHQQVAQLLGLPLASDGKEEGGHWGSSSEGQSRTLVRLINSQPADVERALLKILGSRLEPLPSPGPDQPGGYRVRDGQTGQADMILDESGEAIVVRGNPVLARQLARLIQALDRLGTDRDVTTRIVPIRTTSPGKLKQAFDAYRQTLRPTPPPSQAKPSGQPPPDQEGRRLVPGGIALVGYLFQQQPGPAEAGAAEEQPSEEEAGEGPRQLARDVEIETLPDLDIIILRGRDRDVEELARIIEELERLSVEAEPEIDIRFLKHVNGESLVEIINEVENDLIGGRQGRVSVLPLVKPNALLLIGWGEALEAIKRLIWKLDQPVAPETQLQVFRLKHAPVGQIQDTIQDFFDDREGLGPQLIVSSDPRSNALIVQASPRDMQEVRMLIERLDTTESAAVNQARIFKIKNALADDLADTLQAAISAARGGTQQDRSAVLEFLAVDEEGMQQLRSGILAEVQITPNTRNNTLLVTAPAESMDLLAALIEQLDAPMDVAQIKVFRILNGDANSLITMLRSLFPVETGGAPGPRLAGAEGETSLVPLRFSVDARSNSIIATGSPGDLDIIEALLLRLDAKGLNLRENQVYRLKNAPATQVAQAINDFLRSERIVQQAAPGIISPFQQVEREVVVVPEPVSNSLILSATPRYFEEVEKLIEKLDEEPPQVVIQVLIAEIELDNTDEFGVELGLQDSVLFDRSLLSELETISRSVVSSGGQQLATEDQIIAASSDPGFRFNSSPVPDLPNSGSEQSTATSNIIGTQGLTNFAVGRMNNELGFGGLVLSASSESVSILIRALQESRRVDILSRPQIRTLDNQSAFIQIGERVPYITSSNVTGNGTISNATELVDVGLILGVTPRISPDGMVVMEIDAEKSKLGDETDGITILVAPDGSVVRSPRINTTFAQATVSASDGETIILGGLITKGTASIERRVPFLADVPVLGHLFRYDGLVTERKELLIILTPHIIRGPEDSERLRQLETARMSWCCADVHALHGVPELCTVTDCDICDGEVPVIYPDFDPRDVPRESVPAGEGSVLGQPGVEGPVVPPGNLIPAPDLQGPPVPNPAPAPVPGAPPSGSFHPQAYGPANYVPPPSAPSENVAPVARLPAAGAAPESPWIR